MANIQDMTPVEIDTILSGLWHKQEAVERKIEKLLEIKTLIMEGGHPSFRTARDGIRLSDDLFDAIGARAGLIAQVRPYENEWIRRGYWNRYFLVQNDNGHVHRSMHCSTCNREGGATRFGWMVEFSGKDEQDLTDEIGPNACTVCFPWAETIRIEADAAARKARQEARDTDRAAKARVAAEKGITTPEGDAVYEDKDNSWKLNTLRTAEIAATDALYELIMVQRQALDPESEWLFQNGRTVEKRTLEIARHAWCLLRSIAAKKGETFEETFQIHEKKAQTKIRKTDREWAKDPRNPNRSK